MRVHTLITHPDSPLLALAPAARSVGAGRLQFDSQPARRPHRDNDEQRDHDDERGSRADDGTSGASTTASVEIGNTINYGSMGTTATLDCADGKSLNVGRLATTR